MKRGDKIACVGKPGAYHFEGVAYGAGESRGNAVFVYRDADTGRLFFRTPQNFVDRMTPIITASREASG